MSETTPSWKTISELIAQEKNSELAEFLETLPSRDTARAVSRLTEKEKIRLLTLLSPHDAADVIEYMPEVQAAEVVEDMPSEQAAAIMGEMTSDHLADVLEKMDSGASNAILLKMPHDDAEEARRLLAYDANCAGGLMISEFLAYSSENTISDVLDDLQKNHEKYRSYHVQYFYVTDTENKLVGVLRIHDLLFPPRDTQLSKVMIASPLSVPDTANLSELQEFFEEHTMFGVPVVDRELEHLSV